MARTAGSKLFGVDSKAEDDDGVCQSREIGEGDTRDPLAKAEERSDPTVYPPIAPLPRCARDATSLCVTGALGYRGGLYKLGVSYQAILGLWLLSVFGSYINIPVASTPDGGGTRSRSHHLMIFPTSQLNCSSAAPSVI